MLPNTETASIGVRLRRFMSDNGLSLSGVQRRLLDVGCTVSRQTVLNWCNGSKPRESRLDAIANLLGMSRRDVILASHGLACTSAA
jgi:transcriptional regulator with XRE-family HTH domain